MAKIAVIGAGTWSLALTGLLTDGGHDVTVWSESEQKANDLRERRRYDLLPGLTLSDDITFVTDFEQAVNGADIILIGVASPYVRSVARGIAPFAKKEQIIVNVAKGVEEDTLMFPDAQILSEISGANVAVLSGPSHAEEVARKVPTTIVIGANDEKTAKYLQDIFMSPVFRVYASSDILGIEIGGSLKNVIALAAGMADGLGYGDNTKAAIITRGLAEITRLGNAMGAKTETMFGLAGIGDLIVTCASMHSRNRRTGILLGQGKTLGEAMDEVGMAVEGVYSAAAAKKLSEKYNVEMPIVDEVNKILFEDKSVAEALADLMMRDKKVENSNATW